MEQNYQYEDFNQWEQSFINNLENAKKEAYKKENYDEDAAIHAFEKLAYEYSYAEYLTGQIFDIDHLSRTLDFFLREKDLIRSRYIVYIINHYYNNHSHKILEKYINEEKYELCEFLSKIIDTNILPEIR